MLINGIKGYKTGADLDAIHTSYGSLAKEMTLVSHIQPGLMGGRCWYVAVYRENRLRRHRNGLSMTIHAEKGANL